MMKRYPTYFVLFVFCFAAKVFSQATTVNVAGTSSTLTITNNTSTAVDSNLIVTADGDLTDFTVSITGSYTSGDILSYTEAGDLPSGISTEGFNTTTKSLVFTGTTTAANWQELLRRVTITTTSASCYQEQRQVSFVVGNKFYNPMNGHFYESVPSTINWVTSLANAASKSYFGREGYLVTITSLAENSFIWKIMAADSWIGASDNDVYINAAAGTTTYAANTGAGSSDGRWYWVAGPEKGNLFSVGNSTPVTQSGQFAQWANGEPNGADGAEDCGEFYAGTGMWNDLSFGGTLSSYIVEYGGMSSDNLRASVVFTRNLYISGAPSGTITGGNTSVCSGTNSTTLTLSGLVNGVVDKWQYSYDNFLTAGIDIVNTSTNLTITNCTQNTYYRAIVTTTSPVCSNLATSSTVVYVSDTIAGNIVADNNSISEGLYVNFILNGSSGTVTKWQVSTSNTFASDVADIANTTAAMSYQLNATGTYYFRAVISGCKDPVSTAAYTVSCITGPSATSVLNKYGQLVADASQAIDKYGGVAKGIGHKKSGKSIDKPLASNIGDSYLGGKIAYVFVSGDAGYVAGQVHGIIVSSSNLGNIRWYNGTNKDTGVRATALGTGLANTDAIITSQVASTSYAAGLARAYRVGSYTDWYLPSKEELNKLYLNKEAIGISNAWYWSSSEKNIGDVWAQNFANGLKNGSSKDNVFSVLSVHYF